MLGIWLDAIEPGHHRQKIAMAKKKGTADSQNASAAAQRAEPRPKALFDAAGVEERRPSRKAHPTSKRRKRGYPR